MSNHIVKKLCSCVKNVRHWFHDSTVFYLLKSSMYFFTLVNINSQKSNWYMLKRKTYMFYRTLKFVILLFFEGYFYYIKKWQNEIQNTFIYNVDVNAELITLWITCHNKNHKITVWHYFSISHFHMYLIE